MWCCFSTCFYVSYKTTIIFYEKIMTSHKGKQWKITSLEILASSIKTIAKHCFFYRWVSTCVLVFTRGIFDSSIVLFIKHIHYEIINLSKHQGLLHLTGFCFEWCLVCKGVHGISPARPPLAAKYRMFPNWLKFKCVAFNWKVEYFYSINTECFDNYNPHASGFIIINASKITSIEVAVFVFSPNFQKNYVIDDNASQIYRLRLYSNVLTKIYDINLNLEI